MAVPPPLLGNGSLKAPPRGFIPAKGGTEQNSSTPEVPSGPVSLTCLWPQPRQRLFRLSDRAPVADRRAQPTNSRNFGWKRRKSAAARIWALHAQKFLSVFSVSRHAQRTGWRDSTVCSACHLRLRLEVGETGAERQTGASLNTLTEGGELQELSK